MKVLLVYSGNSKTGISPIIKSQGESLRDAGVDVDYFPIVGKGLNGYLKNVLPLIRCIKKNTYNIVHAHYSLSALVATLAGCKPLVVSLMGSDIRLGFFSKYAVKVSSRLFWADLIVKSQNMMDKIGIEKCKIIPNGVNISLFKSGDRTAAIETLGWNGRKRHILFSADPSRPEKNVQLIEKAFSLLDSAERIELHTLGNIPHQDIQKYINASDVVVLTSLWEGSPNVVKEAMACDRPIVSTDVGDVRWVIGGTHGCFITFYDPDDVTAKLRMALDFSTTHGRTQGRDRIIELGLDSETIVKRIIGIYESVLKRKVL